MIKDFKWVAPTCPDWKSFYYVTNGETQLHKNCRNIFTVMTDT